MSPEAVTAIGTIIGALIAAITFLFKALVSSKNETIKILEQDRDYWRGAAEGRHYYEHSREGS